MLLEPFQSNLLFITVGTNLLPSAIAAKLLVAKGGRVVPIVTERTWPACERLTRYFNFQDTKIESLEPLFLSDPADNQVITSEIGEYLENIDLRIFGDDLGLHYTGGTKAMSVHAHAAITAWCRIGKFPPPKLTYLDANTFSIIMDSILPEDDQPGIARIEPYDTKRGGSKVSLAELLLLHDWDERERNAVSFTEDVTKAIAALYGQQRQANDVKIFRSWQDSIQPVFDANLPPNQMVPLPSGGSSNIQTLRQALKADFNSTDQGIPTEHLKLLQNDYRANSVDNSDFIKYFTGGAWLECRVFDALKKNAIALDLHDVCWSLKADIPRAENVPRPKHPAFEVDVVALQGYQLFAFSCGMTNDRDELKKKFFEIYLRSRQIGGDEARCALVGNIENSDNLQREISRTIGREGQIKVFGAAEIPNLTSKIGQWIKQESATPRKVRRP